MIVVPVANTPTWRGEILAAMHPFYTVRWDGIDTPATVVHTEVREFPDTALDDPTLADNADVVEWLASQIGTVTTDVINFVRPRGDYSERWVCQGDIVTREIRRRDSRPWPWDEDHTDTHLSRPVSKRLFDAVATAGAARWPERVM